MTLSAERTRSVDSVPHNTVVLCGRVSTLAGERTMPSGDILVTTRVVVGRNRSRAGAAGSGRSKQLVDAIDCIAWSSRVQRTIRRWQPGDQVWLQGALRRRFYPAGNVTLSRVEVEATRARRIGRGNRP